MTNGLVCVACGSTRVAGWFVKRTPHGDYPLLRCLSCGCAFVHPRPSAAAVDAIYRSVGYCPLTGSPEETLRTTLEAEARFPNAVVDAARIAAQCARLRPPPGLLLDVGGGYGFFSRAAAEIGYEVESLEPSPASRAVYRLLVGREPRPEMLGPDFVEQRRGSFAVVLMIQVLEHVPDLEGTLRVVHDLLEPGGLSAVAVPRFRSWVSRVQGQRDMFVIPPEHLNFFTPRGLDEAFFRAGLMPLGWATSSRFDPVRVRARLPGLLAPLAIRLLRIVLRLSDALGGGLYLNAYYRKPPTPG